MLSTAAKSAKIFQRTKESPPPGGRLQMLTYREQDKVLLVVFADTVVDPRTVVVHLANAPLTNTETTHNSDLQQG